MKLNYKRTLLISFAFMSLSAFWQMYDNVIPLILQNPLTFGLGETVTGIIMAIDNVLAIFLMPFFGALSDKANTKIGKRMPFIVFGTIVAVVMLLTLTVAERLVSLPLFIVILFILLMAMSLYRSPAVALMPDLTPNQLRSKGNAIINLMGAVGGAYALVAIMVFTPKNFATDPSHLWIAEGHPNYLWLFVAIVAFMLIAVMVLFATIKERKISHIVKEEIASYEKVTGEKVEVEIAGEGGAEDKKAASTGHAFRHLDAPVRKSMIFLLASIFLWFTAYNAVTTAFSRYAIKVWGVEGGGYAQLLMIAMVTAIIAFIPIGIISSKIGRKKTILIGIVLMSVCYFLAAFMTSVNPLMYVFFGTIGIGWASINVNSYPMVVEMAKGHDIGRFTGIYYVFSMSAQIFTPVFSGFLLEHVSYKTLFPYAVIFSVLAFITMTRVYHGDSKPLRKVAIENFDVDD